MHLFFNALAASAGAGLTYVRNIVPIVASRQNLRATIALSPPLRREFGDFPNITFAEAEVPGAARRFWHEQKLLPKMIGESRADVLISTGNFALRKSPVPQILLSGNSLYTSRDFFHDLRARGDYGLWLDTRIKGVFAKRSIDWADQTVAPSQAFADDLSRWTGKKVVCVHHGFDQQGFFGDSTPLPAEVRQKLASTDGAVKLLFVSHYNYYRNVETLFRALPRLRNERKIKLVLTCKLNDRDNPGSYRTKAAAELVRELGISDDVVELGAVPYHLLHHLYRACDIYVTPAYAETFAHPLVEAMASGLPIIASNLAVHQEICGQAAVYFDRFSPEMLAHQALRLLESPQLATELSNAGRKRAQDFSWSTHVESILDLAEKLLRR